MEFFRGFWISDFPKESIKSSEKEFLKNFAKKSMEEFLRKSSTIPLQFLVIFPEEWLKSLERSEETSEGISEEIHGWVPKTIYGLFYRQIP